MDDRLEKLNEKAKALPKAPGVYLMKDDKGRVIYVGKSASLRDRVGSYFQPSTRLEYKKAGMLGEVVDFEIVQTETLKLKEGLFVERVVVEDVLPVGNSGWVRIYNPFNNCEEVYPYDVFLASGGGGNASVLNGILINLNGKIQFSPGSVNGEVIGGKDISFVSGANVNVPTPPTTTVPEPATFLLVGSGLAAFVARLRSLMAGEGEIASG